MKGGCDQEGGRDPIERALAQLIGELEVQSCHGPREATVRHLCFDSRKARLDSLFVALPGKYCDGHAFLDDAFARGAAVAVGQNEHTPPAGKTYVRVPHSRRALSRLAAAFYGHPTRTLWTVGITGTKGKTSVAHYCQAVLDHARCLSTVTNAAAGLENTTPESLDIQRLAHEALLAGRRRLVLEVSAHGLVHQRVNDVAFDAAVFTNLSQDHFDDFDGFDAYFQAKAQLFNTMQTPTAIINADDAFGKKLIQQTPQRLLSYGLKPQAQVYATALRLRQNGSRFKVHTPTGVFVLNARQPGRFGVYNLLAAVAVGVCAGVPLERIKTGLESVKRVPGRFEQLDTPQGVRVVVDFAHSPDSLAKMLGFLKEHYAKVVAVFGCGGESDPYKRPIMGRISGQLADYTVITHDNPKREDPQQILSQIESGVRQQTARYDVIADRATAIRHALSRARPGDCVLVAGKGHETEQIFGQQHLPFNDRQFLMDACGALPVADDQET